MKGMMSVSVAALVLMAAGPARATLLHYTISGTGDGNVVEYASFYLDSKPNPLPENAGPGDFRLKFVSGEYRFGSTFEVLQDVVFFDDYFGGGLVVVGTTVQGSDPDFFSKTLLNYGGPQLFTGTENAPTLLTGDFTLADYNSTSAPPISLKVAAVPEVGSWALMVAGFGLVGATIRRQRTRLCLI